MLKTSEILRMYCGVRHKGIELLLLMCCLWGLPSASGQNELYIKGAELYLQSGAYLHVEGDVHLDQPYSGSDSARLENSGILEVRGDFYFESGKVVQKTNAATSEGIVRLKNYDAAWKTIPALENTAQFIRVENGAAANGRAAFHILEIENENRSATPSDSYVGIQYGGTAGTIVEVGEMLAINNNARVITDDAGYIPTDGSTYDHTLYISNPSPLAIAGASTTPGDLTRYVEGKLARAVAGSNDYYFPVGLAPYFTGNDGMEAFRLTITGNAALQTITAYMNPGQQDVLVPYVYCDIGEHPGTSTSSFSGCSGSPDGIPDLLALNTAQSHEWVIENDETDFDYTIELYPGPGLNSTASHASGSCGGSAYYLRFPGKDGALNGPVVPAPDPFPWNAPDGYATCPPATLEAGNILTGQTGFSTFRIYGASDDATLLPVELVSLTAEPVDDRFIGVEWITNSEVNNDYFILRRSTDAALFEDIAMIGGHGTTTEVNTYTYYDDAVERNVTYYYQLKQVDFDGTSELSEIVHAQLAGQSSGYGISLYPNPVYLTEPTLQITTGRKDEARLTIFNSVGQLVHQETVNVSPGLTTKSLPTVTLPGGTYIVHILLDGQSFTEHLVIL